MPADLGKQVAALKAVLLQGIAKQGKYARVPEQLLQGLLEQLTADVTPKRFAELGESLELLTSGPVEIETTVKGRGPVTKIFQEGESLDAEITGPKGGTTTRANLLPEDTGKNLRKAAEGPAGPRRNLPRHTQVYKDSFRTALRKATGLTPQQFPKDDAGVVKLLRGMAPGAMGVGEADLSGSVETLAARYERIASGTADLPEKLNATTRMAADDVERLLKPGSLKSGVLRNVAEGALVGEPEAVAAATVAPKSLTPEQRTLKHYKDLATAAKTKQAMPGLAAAAAEHGRTLDSVTGGPAAEVQLPGGGVMRDKPQAVPPSARGTREQIRPFPLAKRPAAALATIPAKPPAATGLKRLLGLLGKAGKGAVSGPAGIGAVVGGGMLLDMILQQTPFNPEARAVQAQSVASPEAMMTSMRADEIRRNDALAALQQNPELASLLERQASGASAARRGMIPGEVRIGGSDSTAFQNPEALRQLLGLTNS